MDLLESQQQLLTLWNEESWPISDPSDAVHKASPSVNRPHWSMTNNFIGNTADMGMTMSSHATTASSIVATHPISATAPDSLSTMNQSPFQYLTQALLNDFHDQPGQGQDPTRKREAPSDDEDADNEEEEEEEEEEEVDEEDGEGEEEEEVELDDDGSGLYQEHHVEIKPEHARERSDSNATRRPTGNNPYGSRGCESCVACRRRKGKVSSPLPPCMVKLIAKCIYDNKDNACQFCSRMNHPCGPKVTKVEFQTIQNGKPCPQLRLSEIAKEVEREFPMKDARQLYIILGQRLNEAEQKRQQLQNGTAERDRRC